MVDVTYGADHPLNPIDITEGAVNDVCHRVDELRSLNAEGFRQREKIRDIMNGGNAAYERITGNEYHPDADDLPMVNMMLMANRRLAQKLGAKPDVKIDPPATRDHQRARRYAEKRERIIESWDRAAKLKLQLLQNGRWLPGYGFTPWTISQKKDINNDPYPHMSIRDPFNAFPGQWGIEQQPRDIAFLHHMTEAKFAQLYPDVAEDILSQNRDGTYERIGRGIVLDTTALDDRGSWGNQSSQGVEIYEYVNENGTWWVLPKHKELLEFVPNPLSTPPFYVLKRVSFDKLKGQYDHTVGLMAAITRMNILMLMATEEAVFAETNIYGETMSGDYEQGHNATNKMMPNSKVEKLNTRIPFEVFRESGKLEAAMRQAASYTEMDDGVSPNSFVTGRGLDELKGAVNNEVEEYQVINEDGLIELDGKRFQWAEVLYGGRKLKMDGVRQGAPFSETYKPTTHIDGNYLTRREYGMMATWDEPTAIIGGLNLLEAGIISRSDVRENIKGIKNHLKSAERVRDEQIESALLAGLQAGAEQNDPRALSALINMLPESDTKEMLEEFYLEPLEEEQGQIGGLGGPQAPGGGPGQGQPPPTQTMLNRLTNTSQPTQGVQTVSGGRG